MARIGGPGMSDELRAELWRLWGDGKSFSEISRAIGYLLGVTRHRRGSGADALTSQDRERISPGLASGDSLRLIAHALGSSASTISRELARNKGRYHYRVVDAGNRAVPHPKRPKKCSLARNPVLRGYVAARLREDCLPEQIAGTLTKRHPAGGGIRVSHER